MEAWPRFRLHMESPKHIQIKGPDWTKFDIFVAKSNAVLSLPFLICLRIKPETIEARNIDTLACPRRRHNIGTFPLGISRRESTVKMSGNSAFRQSSPRTNIYCARIKSMRVRMDLSVSTVSCMLIARLSSCKISN